MGRDAMILVFWTLSFKPAFSLSSFTFIKRLFFTFCHKAETTISSVQPAQLCLILCDPIDCSTPGFPVHHQLLELIQTHVHQVGDAIQLSPPLSSPSPPTFSLSQHQGLFPVSQLFTSGGQSSGASASVLPMNIQDWLSLEWTGLISLRSKWLSRVFCNTTVHFFIVQLSHPYVTIGKTSSFDCLALTRQTFVGKVMSLLFNMLSRFVGAFLPRSNRL